LAGAPNRRCNSILLEEVPAALGNSGINANYRKPPQTTAKLFFVMSAFGVKADITIAAECLLMTPSGLNASKSMGGLLINFWRKQFLAVFNLFPQSEC
jgi:hypothetical protein